MRMKNRASSEGLEPPVASLQNLRSEHIGEQVAAYVSQELPVLSQPLAGTVQLMYWAFTAD